MSAPSQTQAPGRPPLYTNQPLALLATPSYETGKKDPITQEASHMVLSHNSFIRGFNTIYQQAPRISPADTRDFIGYCLAWHACVEEHHHYEEVHLFPAINAAVGEEGVMDGEVEQHATFHAGMEAFKEYLVNPQNAANFSARELIAIMDSFSEPLYTHLKSEIQSLLALSRFSTTESPIDLAKMALEAGKKSVTTDFVLNVLPVFLLNMETVEFEGGMWHGVFPPVSKPVKFILTGVVPMWQRQRWEFASCNGNGTAKHLAV